MAILAVVRVSEQPKGPPVPSVKDKYSECKRPIWISKRCLPLVEAQIAKPVCAPCVIARFQSRN